MIDRIFELLADVGQVILFVATLGIGAALVAVPYFAIIGAL